MKSIIFICPYFGHLPNYFDLVLISCKYNKDINWLIITDDKTKYNYPPNVRVIYTSFDELKIFIQNRIPFKINLDKPYKLCDYRPLYGYIFNQYINKYDFWGHCDFDCVFGHIRKFLNDSILDKYDKILSLGHLSIYNNSLNNIMKDEINKNNYIKKILMNDKSYHFDESGINIILKKYNKKIYIDEKNIADIYCLSKPFKLVRSNFNDISNEMEKKMNWDVIPAKMVFSFNKGMLKGYFIYNNNIKSQEYMYVHLQKRKMLKSIDETDKFIIIPNCFSKFENININSIKRYTKTDFLYIPYFKIRFANLKKKIKDWIC